MQSSKFLGAASALVLAFGFASNNAQAQHALPGTEINNTASVNYTIGTVTSTANSNLVTVTVLEVIDVTVARQTAASTTVSPGATALVSRYRVQNTGNGSELFRLVLNNAITTDNFDPIAASPAIYIDSATGTVGSLDSSDIVYVPGAETPMAPDDFIIVFVVNDIPASALDGQQGVSRLTAESRTGTGPAGTTFAGQGNGINGAVDAVIGASMGADSEDSTYQIAGVSVTAVKTQTVVDDWGGARPVPGARINYSIAVSTTGSGTATNVVFTDNIPANTTYVAGTLALNGTPVSDAVGGSPDDGDYVASPTPRVRVPLGSLATSDGTKTITFTVTIN